MLKRGAGQTALIGFLRKLHLPSGVPAGMTVSAVCPLVFLMQGTSLLGDWSGSLAFLVFPLAVLSLGVYMYRSDRRRREKAAKGEAARLTERNKELERLTQDLTEELARAKRTLEQKEAFLDALTDSARDGILMVNDRREKVLLNQRYIDLRRLPDHVAKNKDDEQNLQYVVSTVRNPEEFHERVKHLYAHPEETDLSDVELADGTILERYTSPVYGRNGEYYGRIWTVRDVTEQRLTAGTLRWKALFLEAVVKGSHDGILVLDTEGRKVIENRMAVDLWKLPQEVIDDEGFEKRLNHYLRLAKKPLQFRAKIDHFLTYPDETGSAECELKDGSLIETYSSPIFGQDGRRYGRIWIFRDVTEVRQYWDMMENLSTTDGLTGIANRRRFDETLAREWMRAGRSNSPISLILIDIDHFKEYNDLYGHLAGDDCLRRVAEALEGCVRHPGDVAARYGGEEFACILRDVRSENAMAVAERIREEINSLAIPHASSRTAGHVTVSLGIGTMVPQKEQSESDLIQLADGSLYSSKESGRNQVTLRTAPPSSDPESP